jgi:hypothetical protein
MSWAVFWIDPKQVGPQIGVATTSLLTLIAYRFLLGGIVPRVSYLTRLDIFILGSTILVFLALVEAVVTGQLGSRDKERLALRIDRWSRLAFLVVFLGVIAFAFVI